MKLSEKKTAARLFAEKWKDKGYEKGDSDKFWLELLQNVYGVSNVFDFIKFEEQVHLDHTSFIDAWVPLTHVLIEQKSIDKDLRKKIKQSDGTELTPFQQAKRYSMELPYSERPRWIVTCNFKSFLIYDMENPSGEPQEVLLKNLGKEFYRLEFITELGNEHIEKEMEISLKAGDLVGEIYDAFSKQYLDITNEHSIQSLNKLCVRLVFCLYAEDACLFGEKGAFHDYLASFDYKRQRQALIDLFKVLNTPYVNRDPYMDEKLAAFPYVNGGMFADDDIEIPQFTEEISKLILSKAADDFDWSDISPTIFGAVFESTLNPETRRSGGMHYTSIENIHKVIDPLFLNDLKEELKEIKSLKRERILKLEEFQKKIASLKFLDPACGSGNFLTETYISLRRIENEIIKTLNKEQTTMWFDDKKLSPIKVSINQFYGIEINDFAVSVAKTALWIAEAQMLEETKRIVISNIDFFPLKTYTNIIEANALTYNWNDLVDKNSLSFIMGNPPFIGFNMQSKNQKNDILNIYVDESGRPYKNSGSIDYVSGWFFKSAEFIVDSTIRCALVATNSITQGEQVSSVWKPIYDRFNITINFAHRTFVWDSEASDKAHVHCVIIGFSSYNTNNKIIYTNGAANKAKNINCYLLDSQNVFLDKRTKPLCKVHTIRSGNKSYDDGNLTLSKEEAMSFLDAFPNYSQYIKKYINSKEFIHNEDRYCLWLVEATPDIIKNNNIIFNRVKKCREARMSSTDASTRALADRPHLFRETVNPKSAIVIPLISSENRRYIPIGFIDDSIIAGSNIYIIPDANLYEFGVLTSYVHMIWTRTVCGRLKSDIRYSGNTLYNNFPWPKADKTIMQKIEDSAKEILNARKLYPEASLADLYDDVVMPVELRKAHHLNDKLVMDAYGFDVNMTESEILAKLMEMYKKLTS